MDKWFDDKKFLEYISDEKNRNHVLDLLEEESTIEVVDDKEFKSYEAMTITDETDLKRIQSHLRVEDKRLYICWMISQNTGLRGSDIVKLTIHDLKKAIKDGSMIVVEEKIEHIMESKLKNNRPIKKNTREKIARTVYLNDDLISILEEFVRGKRGSEFLYPAPRTNGKHIRRDTLGKKYKRELVKLGIAKGQDVIGTHTPRKTYGYIQYKEHGEDINYVQNLFCHSSPKITRVYIGLDERARKASAETMNKYTY